VRRLIALASVKGSPGVTTTALAMAAAWPVDADGGVRPVVVEADVAGGDVAARLGLSHVPGLLDVAATAHRPVPGSVLGAAQELPFGVRAVLAPAGAGQCRQAVRLLEEDAGRVLRGGVEDAGTVILDVGRVERLDQGLVSVVDAVVLVTGGGADALAHVFPLRDAVAASKRPVVAVVGDCPYRQQEVVQVVGTGSTVFVPWAPGSADILAGSSRARLRRSGWRRSPLLGAAEQLAAHLTPASIPESVSDGTGSARTPGRDADVPAASGAVLS
jgi:hypothetical protein